ncbi:MAG: histidinol phosphatase [Deltaproteobacteria bacterium]|nr:histidinol phosphatase [Deltaproteobacteria bacterium]MBW2394318.1 histidinol phosphatase [Deltaproteobacteria bacterium]
MPLDLTSAADFACAAADAARREILPRFRRVAVETKSDGSPVTEADRSAEQAIRSVLRGFDPTIGILGEEFGSEGSGEGLRWVVDPIDGTIGFSRGIALFSTIIALLEDGEPVLGLIDLPALQERYVGWKGAGVRRGQERVHVSQESDPRQAMFAHGDAFCFDAFGERAAFDRMVADFPIFRGYTDAFGHAQVLHGGVDAMVDVGLNPWDAAATQILVPEAGGRCVTIDRSADGRGLGLLFGSPALVETLQSYLEG